MPLVSFYTPWNHQKTRDSLTFSGGRESDKQHEMGYMFFYMESLQNHAEKSLPMTNLHKSWISLSSEKKYERILKRYTSTANKHGQIKRYTSTANKHGQIKMRSSKTNLSNILQKLSFTVSQLLLRKCYLQYRETGI